MRKRIIVIVAVVLAIAAGNYFLLGGTGNRSAVVELASAAPTDSGACTFPTAPAATPEETAWLIFIAANCPAKNNQLVWETWVEQLQLYPANGHAEAGLVQGVRRLHASPLALARGGKSLAKLTPENDACNPMQGKPLSPPSPPLIAKPTICEEVHLNPTAQQFVTSNKYQTRPPQAQAAQNEVTIGFPEPAIEVKVDWIPASDFQPRVFTCTNPPQGVHVEMIDGTCYALAGMHIESKLLPKWLWASFEPQSMTTNPLRCITFGPCNDSFGSIPATSSGGANGFTRQTSTVTDWMKQAGLAPEFLNYRLDGTQTDFTTPNGQQPTLLGNSIIEGENVGMTSNTASCITCHSVSSIKNDGTDGITVLAKMLTPPVGPQYQVPPHWIARDFVWSMGLACPAMGAGGVLQDCTGSSQNKVKQK